MSTKYDPGERVPHVASTNPRRNSIDRDLTPPGSPMHCLGKSQLYRSVVSNCESRHSFDEDDLKSELDFLLPFSPSQLVLQRDITENGFPPDQRAGPTPAHMHLIVNIKRGINTPAQELGSYVEVSVLSQTRKQSFEREQGCTQPFKFFIHETTLIEEELGTSDSHSRAVVRIEFNSCASDVDVGLRLFGSADFALRDLLRQPIQGEDFAATIVDRHGTPVLGSDGAPLQVIVSFCLQPLEGDDLQVVLV